MRESKVLWWVIGLGLALRLALWCFQVNPAGDDGERYYCESRNLVEHGVFSTGNGADPQPTAHDLPLWPGTMAGILWATDSKAATTRIAGLLNVALMMGAVGFVISLLGHPPFHVREGGKALAAAIMLFLPDAVPYSLFHMPDPMALFFLCGAIGLFFRGVYGKRGWLLASSVAFGCAILSKPICLPVAGAFLAMLLFLLPTGWIRRCGWVALCGALVGLLLAPWMLRNKQAFGQAGLTTISGTNLYGCNWGWMVASWPKAKRAEALRGNAEIEAQTQALDLMSRSKALGAYAQKQLFAHLPDYALFTAKKHPRLYAGTGTVALCRYLGMESVCHALTKTTQEGKPTKAFTKRDRTRGAILQGGAFAVLALGYLLVFAGFCVGVRKALASRSLFSHASVALGSAAGGVLLLAVVIGPVVATRYRFMMLPFFACLAALADARACGEAAKRLWCGRCARP